VTRRLPALLLAAMLPVVVTAQAETQYVTDQYDFNLRAGESTRYKITSTLPSGTPLEILSVNAKSGYAHVRTKDGETGYILTRYLQKEPAARGQLAAMRTRLQELQQAPDQLAAKLSALQQSQQTLIANYNILERNKEQLERELAEVRHASANAVRINQERQRLQDQVAELMETVSDLEHSNLELANHREQRWFLIGAGVVGGGILLGLILPNLRLRRRRSSWESL
jgi:SH3 domain protein